MQRDFYEFGQISTVVHEADQIIAAAVGSGTALGLSATFTELECQPGDLVHSHYLNHYRVKAKTAHEFKILALIPFFM